MSDTVVEALSEALDAALAFDENVAEPPIALLWPDKGRQWEPVISMLDGARPVVRLGEFVPEPHQGPAYWLRCVIAGLIELDDLPTGAPIVYLPGLSREDLRTLESAPRDVAPLAALQYRCEWFSHPNGRDWTIRGFLSNGGEGLGLSIATDDATSEALVASIGKLAALPLARLSSRFVDAGFLNDLINPDPVGAILNWLDDPVRARTTLGENGWNAFAQQCRQDYGIDPGVAGEIRGARMLGDGEGPWAEVWARFRQSPDAYQGIPDRLRQAQPSELVPRQRGAWPAFADEDEGRLRNALEALRAAAPADARAGVIELDAEHKERRGYVWADLGWTPLVLALEHLAEVARVTGTSPSVNTVAAIQDWYGTSGWRADSAMMAALAEVDRRADLDVVEAVLGAIYRPWAHAVASALQDALGSAAYSASGHVRAKAGDAVVFVDGLRLDLAHALAERLAGAGLDASVSLALAALPTVTPTAKPAVALVGEGVLGPGAGLDARRLPDGPSASAPVLRAVMSEADVQTLAQADVGDPTGVAWTEAGDIDRRGHDFGIRLAQEVEVEIDRVARRVRDLIDCGWPRVTVVTDHGWLLIPGRMNKTNLPAAVTEVKKGRCARLKVGAKTDVPTVPWHWDKDVRIAIAPGITCFEEGKVYEHGGVSPQECVVPRVSVTAGAQVGVARAEITKARWHGLTLVVEFESLPDRATIDLRTEAGDPKATIATIARQTGGKGKVLLLVGDDDLEGERAYLVVQAPDGSLLSQRELRVGVNA